MEKFEVYILGCGSALPTKRHNPTSQVINIREKLFMVDCGEGTQLQFRHAHLKFSRLNHIFISHLHGDHCFGLMGLISTMSLLGRTATLHIHAPEELERLLLPQLDFFCKESSYKVEFHPFNPQVSQVIYSDRSVDVTTIPLHHRVPCAGFLFAEKPTPNHLIREMLDYYQVPLHEFNRIKNGADYVTAEGEIIPNDKLTKPAAPTRKYAYCSDTIYLEENIPLLTKVDLLFHEATFASDNEIRAVQTKHSTSKQAAMLANKAQAKQLLIGHFSARYENEDILLEEAKTIFPHTHLASEGLCFKIE